MSTALSSLNRVREGDLRRPRDPGEYSENRSTTTGPGSEAASHTTVRGGTPSFASSQSRSLVTGFGRSDVSHDRRPIGSEISVASSQKYPISQKSALQVSGKNSRWEGDRRVWWEVPGESGEEKEPGHRKYHKTQWMTEEDHRENARKRLDREREDSEEQRRKDRRDGHHAARNEMDEEADDEGERRHAGYQSRRRSTSRTSSVEERMEAAVEESARKSNLEVKRRAAAQLEQESHLEAIDGSSDLDDGEGEKRKIAKRTLSGKDKGKERERDPPSRKGRR